MQMVRKNDPQLGAHLKGPHIQYLKPKITKVNREISD